MQFVPLLLLRADKDEHEVHLGVPDGDRIRDRLEHGGLARLGRGDDEAALALADGRDQVDDAGGRRRVAVFKAQPLSGVDGSEVVEPRPPQGLVRGEGVDGLDAGQCCIAAADMAAVPWIWSPGRRPNRRTWAAERGMSFLDLR